MANIHLYQSSLLLPPLFTKVTADIFMDLLAHIDTAQLDHMKIEFDKEDILNSTQFTQFISHSTRLKAHDYGELIFMTTITISLDALVVSNSYHRHL
jgi:hypothetical protein